MNVLRNQAELIIVNKQRQRDRKAKKIPSLLPHNWEKGTIMNKYKNKNRYVHIFNNMNYNNTFNISSKWHRNLFFLLKKKPQTLKGQKQKQKNDKLLYKKSAIQHLNINNNNSIFGCKSRSFLQCLNQDEGEKNTKTFLS